MSEPTIGVIDQRLIVTVVAERIRNAIESRELLPGQRIGETEMSVRFQVSRTPVREAFRILESEGYLTHSPRCGVIVKELESDEVVEVFEIRSHLEQLMVRKVVKRITKEELAKLNALADEMVACSVPLEETTFRRLDNEFHSLLVSNCGNERLKEIVSSLKVSTRLVRSRAGFSPDRALQSFHECLEVIAAINEKNTAKAERLMACHFETSLQFFLSHINASPEPTKHKDNTNIPLSTTPN